MISASISMHSIELLESRIAPASLTGRVLTYTDVDGDKVTVSFSKGSLAADNFVFDTAFGSTGAQQLQRIDLIDEIDIEGSNIVVKVAKAATGDGVAHLGEILATGHDLGIVKTKGDLGKIIAGNDTLPAPAIKALNIGTHGMMDGTTQPAGSNQGSVITGDLPKLTLLGDLGNGSINVSGAIQSAKIGGSMLGSLGSSDGRLFAGSIGKIVVNGSIIGSVAAPSAGIAVEGDVVTLKINGSIIGGSTDSDITTSQIRVGGSVGKFIVGHDIRGTEGTGGQETVVVDGTVGSFIVGGSITAASGREASVFLADTVDTPGTAVGSITVGGTVTNALIAVGAGLNRPVTVDHITIGGAFIKSRIVVGSTFGADMVFGTGDDVINAASRLNTLVIKGTVFGTVGGIDAYFIEAGRIGSATLAGRSILVTSGGNMSTVSTSGDVFLRDVV
jgi:hypothetical protein